MSDINKSMRTLLDTIGCPSWLQGTKVKKEYGKESIVVVVNKMIEEAIVSEIPTKVEGIEVSIVYKDPITSLVSN